MKSCRPDTWTGEFARYSRTVAGRHAAALSAWLAVGACSSDVVVVDQPASGGLAGGGQGGASGGTTAPSSSSAGCQVSECPPTREDGVGKACESCDIIHQCAYDGCAPGGGYRFLTCYDLWVRENAGGISKCPGCIACGDDEVCIVNESQDDYVCKPDPCAPNELSCECAGSLCEGCSHSVPELRWLICDAI